MIATELEVSRFQRLLRCVVINCISDVLVCHLGRRLRSLLVPLLSSLPQSQRECRGRC
jgi:hypothetical protein